VPIHQAVFLGVLDAAGDLPADLHDQEESFVVAASLVLDHAQRVRRTPPLRHRRPGQDRPQPFGVSPAAWPDPYPSARRPGNIG
jgi:hypothetical protein